MKTAVIMSEDAAWTTPLDAGYEKCLPKIGLKVLDHIRFSPDTTDFTPIFNKIEALKPDVIITGISHVGTQPTVQWKSQQVPIPMFGISSQATNSTFWKDTNGATEGVLFNAVSGPGVAVTPKTLPFVEAYQKKYGNAPSYSGYTAYDEVYMIADAVKRAGSTDSDKLVDAMEKTDYVGTIGRVAFLPKGDPHVHGLKTGERLHHRPDAAVAGRQAGQRLAEEPGQRQDEVPRLRQAVVELTPRSGRTGGGPTPSGGDVRVDGRPMLFWQILIDGFAISALYALGATGFTLIFGVSGVLNLSHGAIMVAAAVAAWAVAGAPARGRLCGGARSASSSAWCWPSRPTSSRCGRSSARRAIAEAEKEIFILTATLLWGIIIQEAVAYLFTNNAKTVLPIVEGVVTVLGVRTPTNEFFTAVDLLGRDRRCSGCWSTARAAARRCWPPR